MKYQNIPLFLGKPIGEVSGVEGDAVVQALEIFGVAKRWLGVGSCVGKEGERFPELCQASDGVTSMPGTTYNYKLEDVFHAIGETPFPNRPSVIGG